MSVVISVMAIIAVELFFAGLRRIRTPGHEAQIAQYGSLAHTGPRSRYARWVRPYALRLASNVTALRGLTDFEKTARMLDYAGNPAGMTVHVPWRCPICLICWQSAYRQASQEGCHCLGENEYSVALPDGR